MKLDVGCLRFRQQAREEAALVDAGRQRPGAKKEPFDAHMQAAGHRMKRVIGGDGLGASIDQTNLKMILQVLADALAIDHDRYVVRAQLLSWPDARQHQQLRRLDGTGSQHNTMTGVQVLQLRTDATGDATGAAFIDENASDLSVGDDGQIFSPFRWAQISIGGAFTPAVARGQLVVPGTLLACTIEVVIARDAAVFRRGDNGLNEFMLSHNATDPEPPAGSVQLVVPELRIVLELDEVRQDIVPAPPRISEIAPLVVVARLPADDDETVDRARAAEHAPARPINPPAVHVRVRLGVEAPVERWMPHRLAVADGQMDPEISIARSGLEQGDAVTPVFGQPMPEDAAGRAGAHHDEIELVVRHFLLPRSSINFGA